MKNNFTKLEKTCENVNTLYKYLDSESDKSSISTEVIHESREYMTEWLESGHAEYEDRRRLAQIILFLKNEDVTDRNMTTEMFNHFVEFHDAVVIHTAMVYAQQEVRSPPLPRENDHTYA